MSTKPSKYRLRENLETKPKDHKPTPSESQLERELKWMLIEKARNDRDEKLSPWV